MPTTVPEKPISLFFRAVAHNALHSVKRTAADKEDLGSVDFHHGLSRILATALDRHGRNGAFNELEKSLLNTPRPTRRG